MFCSLPPEPDPTHCRDALPLHTMDYFMELTPKLESPPESPLTCKFCLAAESEARLSRRNLTQFYAEFRACGLGLNIAESLHYNWVCQYCWVRAAQCLRFLESARRAELVLNGVLKNEVVVTQETLHKYCNNYVRPPVDLSASTMPPYDTPAYDRCQKQYLEVPLILPQEDSTIETCGIVSTGNIVLQSGGICSAVDPYNKNCGVFTTINVIVPHKFLPDSGELIGKYNDNELPEDGHSNSERGAERPVKCARKKSQATIASSPTRKSKECEEKLPRKDSAVLVAKWRALQVEVLNLSEAEQREEIEQRKRSDKFRSWKFRCEKCGVGFHEEDCIEKHNLTHLESRGDYMCNICLVRFAKPHQLSSHAGNHRRRWRCLRCGETIAKSAYLMPHHAKCTNSAPVTCEQCGKLFSNNLSMRKHISKSHNTLKKYTCDVCGSAFKEKQHIKRHMRIHTGEMPYQCDVCGKKSSTLTSHQIHLTVHDERTQSPETYCVECDQYFKSKYKLRIHLKQSQKHVSRETFRFVCSECPRRFCSSTELKRHVDSVHRKERAHLCTLCNKGYGALNKLSLHMRNAHGTGERPRKHVCDVCGKGFHTSTTLKSHVVAIHFKERPFACQLCPATFGFSGALFTHNRLKHKKQTRAKEQANST